MKNESMPAFPLQFGNDGCPILFNDPRNSEDMLKKLQPAFGLTKLEWFTGMALQGLLMNAQYLPENPMTEAVELAQGVIAELENRQ